MGDKSAIEWTDATWNPVRGCSIVSKGCTNCYAMRQAHRSSGAGGAYEGLTKLTKGGPVWTGRARVVHELVHLPVRWRRPRRIFVNSMSDLFHEDVPDSFIRDVWCTMADCPQHVFQILTKRPQRMRDWLLAGLKINEDFTAAGLPNVWLGVSVEDQASADERIPLLLETPAAVRWISAEPLLGPVDLRPFLLDNRRGLDWVVAGGESGPGARPSHPEWFTALRDQCAAAKARFFFKQWGAWAPIRYHDQATGKALLKLIFTKRETTIGGPKEGTTPYNMIRVGKRAAGRELDGRTHDEYPA